MLRASGAVLENAYLEEAELTRLSDRENNTHTVHKNVNLTNFSAGDENDLELLPNDVFTVKQIPIWREHRRVKISGEIEFPGEYSAFRGERLSSVIERAGGLTPLAFPRGSVFVRRDLKEREARQLSDLQRRLQTEITALSDTQLEARQRGEVLLENLSSTRALGRLVIDLDLAMTGDIDNDVVLEDGDSLVIPPFSQEVTVVGEVQYATSHIYQRGLDHVSYINKSGGLTTNSDFDRAYIIRADGNVVAQGNSKWFRRPGRAIPIRPGDTIVVPFDSDKVSALTLWSSVSQIVYNIGVAAAAVASF